MNRALRNLYLWRIAFAAIWVALMTSAGSSDRPDATASLLTGLLLVIYPLSDVIATLIDLRTNGQGPAALPQRVNAVAGTAATVAVAATVPSSLTTAVHVFAIWAIASGAIQLLVGTRRLATVGGQWPMILSGAGSIIAGTTFAGWSGSPSTAQHALAQYSIGGAVFYLLTALWLSRPTAHRLAGLADEQ
jgi:hypothetical protein